MTTVSKRILSVIKVVVSLGLALALFWYLYRDGFSDTLERLRSVNYSWVVLSLFIGIIAHTVRAYRWKLLMEVTGNYPTLWRSLMALLIGYLVNLAVPRLGEISRCLTLRRSDKIPVTSSLGTVVSERVVDVLTLLMITGITLIIEFEKLNELFRSIFAEKISGFYASLQSVALLVLALAVLLISLWLVLRRKVIQSVWWLKLKSLVYQTWQGILSITRLEKPWKFWAATSIIWLLYYFMSFVVFFAMEPTSHLDWKAGLALVVMGGLAMSAPVQGGIGAFHLLVAGLLIYYGVSKENGLSFAFLLHSSQMVLMIVTGTISVFFMLSINRKASNSVDQDGVKE